jgi:hypothetical protein
LVENTKQLESSIQIPNDEEYKNTKVTKGSICFLHQEAKH